jgi:hypothetical protein
LEGGAEPVRIYKAREKAGDFRYKDVMTEIKRIAFMQFLEDHGCKKGITKEKTDGTYRRNVKLNDIKYRRENLPEYVVEVTKRFYDQFGDNLFDKNPHFRD